MTNLVKKYLAVNNLSHQGDGFEELYGSHPNYPSVYAITDTFDLLSIENIAIKIPKEQFEALPDQFLTFYKGEFALISKSSHLIAVETEEKKLRINTNDFLNGWDGIVIAVEPNTIDSRASGKLELKWLKYVLPILIVTSVSIIRNEYSLNSFFLLLTTITGLLLSVFIIQEDLGVKNETVAKLCNMNSNTSCSSVIKSDKSKVSKWMSFSDLPLLFFGINFLAILFQPAAAEKVIGLLSLLSIPLIIYSLWLQQFQLKKWCVLCLLVSAIILLQGVMYFLMYRYPVGFTLDKLHLQNHAFSAVLFISVWLYLKPFLKAKIKADASVYELKKFKRNYNVFKFLSKEIPYSDGFEKLQGIEFGNRNATMQLTLVLSPSCGHCHKTFEDACGLVNEFPEKTFLKVLFNLNPQNNDNPYKNVVESLLTINNYDSVKAKEAIIDWHIHKMELEVWKKKWLVSFVDMKANHQIHEHYQWCKANQFNYTPVKIINNKQFPEEYEINELKYFLNDFSNEKEVNTDNVLIQA